MLVPLHGSQILKFLPQREPIVMVDTLIFYTEESVTAGLTIVSNNIFVEEDVFAESGLLEHMAQTVAIHTGYSYYLMDKEAPVGYIGSIQQVAIERLPIVGDVIVSKAEIIQEFMGVTLVTITTYLGEAIIATAQMKTVIPKT